MKDISGQRFGRLVAVRPTEERKRGQVVWECRCDCGKITYTVGGNLTYGITKSCGCLQKERAAEANVKDLTGQHFGRLVALRPTEERKRGYIMWECRCDCGNVTRVEGSRLASGGVASCGCLRKEKVAKIQAKDLTGQRFGRLIALRSLDERKNGSIVWECKCDCGSITHTASQDLISGTTRSCGCLRKDKVVQSPTKDLTGQRFGRLVVLRAMEKRKKGYIMWECQCDCGNVVSVLTSRLTNGAVSSCGCSQKDSLAEIVSKDLTGRRFGMLLAVKPMDEREFGQMLWECRCKCGNTVYVRSSDLLQKKKVSCGCIWKKHG